MAEIETLVVRFANRVSQKDIPLLRGAVIKASGGEDELYHNHGKDGLSYRYPLIQYKRMDGRLMVVCVGEGIRSIERFLANNDHELRVGQRNERLLIESIRRETTDIAIAVSPTSYSAQKCMPLNQKNHAAYAALGSDEERRSFLERCLTGNILSFAKNMGIRFKEQVDVDLVRVLNEDTSLFKQVRMQSFDLVFRSNVILPDYIGIGKGVSHGFGTVMKI